MATAGSGNAAQSPLRGVALVTLAVMIFAIADVITKHLTMLYTVPMVVAMRYLVNMGLLAAIFAPRHGRDLVRTHRTGLVILRALCLSAASLTLGLALRFMPVGETIAIAYLAPFLVMVLAIPVLREKVTLPGWIAAVAGFLGVLLIVRPGAGLDAFGVVLALMNAICSAGYHLLSRILARTETLVSMLFMTAIVGFGAFAAFVPLAWDGTWPTGFNFGLMLALGGLATLGHILFTAAYREAPASLLAPVNYLHLVWAGLLGWLVFGHSPDLITGLGMALVAAAGMAVALHTHFSRAKA